jgi:hypothetical protein
VPLLEVTGLARSFYGVSALAGVDLSNRRDSPSSPHPC